MNKLKFIMSKRKSEVEVGSGKAKVEVGSWSWNSEVKSALKWMTLVGHRTVSHSRLCLLFLFY